MALSYTAQIVLALTYLAGLIVAILLLVRVKGTPAILATVAFGILFLASLGGLLRMAFLEALIVQLLEVRAIHLPRVAGGFECCCGVLQLAAIVCLIVAIWQAVVGTKQGGTLSTAL